MAVEHELFPRGSWNCSGRNRELYAHLHCRQIDQGPQRMPRCWHDDTVRSDGHEGFQLLDIQDGLTATAPRHDAMPKRYFRKDVLQLVSAERMGTSWTG
jgi:hypothetical protein